MDGRPASVSSINARPGEVWRMAGLRYRYSYIDEVEVLARYVDQL